jgi:hypothetical protein
VSCNRFGLTGARAIAEAIAGNAGTALTELRGVRLSEHLDVLGVPDDFMHKDNATILAHVREKHLTDRVKSSRGGTR